ncbi:MAG: hypothetical protein ACRC46_12590, partial [Thermoguttaceae bacterium]
MKTLSPIITLLLVVAANFALGVGVFSGDVLMAQTPSELVQAAIESHNDPTTIIKRIERLEKLYENRPDIYVEELWRVVHVLWDCDRRDRSDQWHDLIDRLSTNIIDAKTKYSICKGLQIRVIVSYMRIDPNGSQASIMKLRKERVSKMLGHWQSVNNVVASCSDANAKDAEPFYHPLSPVMGPSPEMMNDPVLQKEYAEHLKKRDALLNESLDQSDAGLVVRNSQGQVKKYLIDSYSLHPFATAELEALLKEHKVDDALAKEVLDAVKEAE